MWMVVSILGAVAFLALCGALVVLPGRWYAKRRRAHYINNPDPLFQHLDD